MRIVSFLIAILVMGALYLMVFERDSVLSFAGRTNVAPETATKEAAAMARPEASETRHVSVVAVHSTARPVDDAVLVRGRTEAARSVEVRSETSGRVISAPLRKGAFVKKDQALCQIDPGNSAAMLAQAEAQLAEARSRLPEARARLDQAQAQLSEAEINDRAAQSLRADGYASQTRTAATTSAVSSAKAAVESAKSGLEAAQTGISSAQAAAASAHIAIDRLTLKAPFAGLLETDSAELGALLQPGALCASILQLDPIKLVAFVAETEVDKVTVGATARARLATGATAQGKVTFLSRSADAATRTFRVEVEIPNADLAIRDGQTVEMVLASGDTQAHLLPQSALTLDDDGHIGVRIVDADKQARFVPVKVLRDTLNGVWVSGLPDTADVITIGQEYVINGVPVDPSFDEVTQ